eukprot:gene11844-biopygen3871
MGHACYAFASMGHALNAPAPLRGAQEVKRSFRAPHAKGVFNGRMGQQPRQVIRYEARGAKMPQWRGNA